ncbi:MAG: PorT family protein [Bacteroidales bacterium]|jgi:hypothetical protein|nr:PorT family protein [Bacteroidales bacterium]
MKKLSVFVVALTLSVGMAQAQFGIKFGARAGLNVNSLSYSWDDVKSENLIGFQIGPVLDVSILGFGVEAGILYNQKGGKFKFGNESMDLRNSYLDIPINLKYSLGLGGIGVYAAIGPNFSLALDGKNFGEVLGAAEELKEGNVKNFEVGLNFGAGVKISKIGIGVQYGLGLSDVYKYPMQAVGLAKDLTAKNRTIAVLLTYYF